MRAAPLRLRPLTVAGLMSGTSGDGIDVAVVRIMPGRRHFELELLTHRGWPFPQTLRAAVLAAQDSKRTSTAQLAQLHWRLGLAYAAAYQRTVAAIPGVAVDLVGCHGQTIYHQGTPARTLGERFRCTWQIGETAPLARKAGVPVVSNLRSADMAAGGQGAPLVPMLDSTLYRDRSRTRLLQNIGGIGNVSVVPPGVLGPASDASVLAFDTGPGNMIIDALMQQLYGRAFDRNGAVGRRGRVLDEVLRTALRDPFFRRKPPRSAGREQFGERFAATLLRACRKADGTDADAIATATALTAHSIHDAIKRFAGTSGEVDLVVSGGGARNLTLLLMLGELFRGTATRVLRSDDPSLPSPLPVEAKEAAAFALLAYLSVHKRPGNVPSATGASEAVVLGQVTCA